jgi:hypothetical protein
MGVHLTLHMPTSERSKIVWTIAFVVIALGTCALIGWQTNRSIETQADLNRQLVDLPKKFPKPPSAEENAKALIALEDQKIAEKAAKPHVSSSAPKITKKSSEQSSTPVAPQQAAAPPPQVAQFSITESPDVSAKADAPYKVRVVVQTNTDFSHLRLAIECSGPISSAQPGNTGMFIGGQGVVNGHPNVYVINYQSIMPPFGPANPIITYLWSVNPINCGEVSTF